ncbi:hypothetical protein SAMN05428977_10875 [Nitrosomonas sp. Nm166]|nr:hypothetical protein SAMN05428977_10875 [Nitrosomonas sp. Nm166]
MRSIWLRHQLANFKHQLAALETKIAGEGIILSDAQIAALEKKKQDDIASGEIEMMHWLLGCTGHLLCGKSERCRAYLSANFHRYLLQGRDCKLYTTRTPITSADILNDKALPFYAT